MELGIKLPKKKREREREKKNRKTEKLKYFSLLIWSVRSCLQKLLLLINSYKQIPIRVILEILPLPLLTVPCLDILSKGKISKYLWSFKICSISPVFPFSAIIVTVWMMFQFHHFFHFPPASQCGQVPQGCFCVTSAVPAAHSSWLYPNWCLTPEVNAAK